MSKIKLKQLAGLFTSPIVVSGFATANGLSNNVTAAVTARLATAGSQGVALQTVNSTGETVQGIVVTAGKNRVEIRKSDRTRLFTTDGRIVYGRLTYLAGVYTLTYYYLNSSNVETVFSISGPITINFLIHYRSKLVTAPFDESVVSINEQLGLPEDNNPLLINNMFANANNKFVTTNGTGKFVATFDFKALNIPFVSGAGIVATNVADALDELKTNPLPNPLTADLKIDDSYRILPQNGNSFIDLRYLADSNLFFGSKYDQTESWALFNTTAAKIAYGANSYITFGATSANLYTASLYLGLNNELQILPNGIAQVTTNTDKVPSALSARNLSINSGLVNTVGLGGQDYIMKTSRAAYVETLVFPHIASGFETTFTSNTLVADIAIDLPNVASKLVYATSLTAGKMVYFSGSNGLITNSIITHNTIANPTLAINGSIDTSVTALVAAYNLAGSFTAGKFMATGGLVSTNTALQLEALNGLVDNIALEIISGTLVQTSGLAAFNVAVDPAVQFNIGTSTLANSLKSVNSVAALALATSGYFVTNGANTKNVGLYVNAINGLVENYGLIVENGQTVFGALTATTATALVEFVSTTSAVKINEMTNVQMLAILSPAKGMIIYNTTDDKFYYYNGTIWAAVSAGGSGTITGTGTAGKIAKFSGATAIADSLISDSGTVVSVGTNLFTVDTTLSQVLVGTPSLGLAYFEAYTGAAGLFARAAYFKSEHTLVNYAMYAEAVGAGTDNYGGYFNATTGANNYALVTNNGFVGIGAVAPIFSFQVGNSYSFVVDIVTATSGFNAQSSAAVLTAASTLAGHTYAAQIYNTNTVAGTFYGLDVSATGVGTTTNIGVYANASGGTNNYAVITNTGRAGFNNTTPAYDFVVGSSAEFGIDLTNNCVAINNAPTASFTLMVVATAAQTDAIYTVINNVGALNTAGNFASGGAGTENRGIQSIAGNATTNVAGYFAATGGTNNYAIVIPTAQGSVGIGTVTPLATALLDIVSTGTTTIAANITQSSVAATNYGVRSFVNGVGTTNIAAYFSARNSTNNYALVVPLNEGIVGIGTVTPNASAILDLTSTTGALLVPRMSTIDRGGLTPADGMIIYNTTTLAFNFYENGAWVTGSGLV